MKHFLPDCTARPVRTIRNLRFARIVATILALSSAGPAFGRTHRLDLRNPATVTTPAAKRQTAAPRGTAAPRTEDSTLRLASLPAGAADVGAVEVGDKLDIALFDGADVSLTLRERTQTPLGGDAFLAEASGAEGLNTAVVLRTEDGLTIDIQDLRNGRIYQVVSTRTGVSVREIEPTEEGRCGCDALSPERSAAPDPDGGGAEPSPAKKAAPLAGAQTDSCVDVLVAYDLNAAKWAESTGGGITNFAQVAVQKMNAALANTGLSAQFRFRLVGVAALPVSATDVHEALYAIADGDPGWKDVPTIRDRVGADIATTLIDTGSAYGTTGVGWSLSSTSSLSSFGNSAFNVCAVRSVAQSHTMSHECGHNLGAGHATLQSTQPGPQLYPYSAGHYFTGTDGKKYCTIMAYTGEGPGGTQIPFFSSPDHFYAGTAAGDATHDNTRTIENTWSYAAKWREQATPTSYDVEFSPATGTLIDGTLDVVLTPGKAGTTIRYTLDGTAPTVSSPIYSSPIRLSQTTTIRASTVVGGVCSLPFSATYYSISDIGYAMGLPEYDWELSVPATSRCGVQTTNTVDGVGIGADVAAGDVCSLSTTMEGPASISWKRMENGNIRLRVLCDGSEVFSDSWSGYSLSWAEQTADIPAGPHRVEFRLESRYGTTRYWLDDFKVFNVAKPVFRPAAGATASTAAKFSGERMVSLSSDTDGARIFYTLDGSDPTGEQAICYDGPFFVSESVKVRAIAVAPGLGTSAVAEGWFVKNDLPKAGEWTLDGGAAFEAVRRDGRMIAELCWNYPGCGWSKALEPVMTDPAFTSWAAMNGIYLLADSWNGKPAPGGGNFYSLYRQTGLYEELGHSTYYPTFVFASAADTDTCLGALLARNDGAHAANGVFYRDSVESLVAGFATFLGSGRPLGPPVPSAANAFGRIFPFSVTLSNTNGTGTVYYTLDGSEPTRTNGIRYTGAITIPRAGTTLKAAVWPSDANAVSGLPLAVTYESLSDTVGIAGLSWANDAAHPWTVKKTSSGVVLSGYKDLSLASGSVSSTLKVSLTGPGMLSYKYDWEPWYSTLSLKRNGSVFSTLQYRQISGETNLVVAAGVTTELAWVYDYSYMDNRYPYLSCDISGIAWTPFTPPSAVADLTASQGTYDDGTLLRWTDADNAETYVAYRGTTADPASAAPIGTTDKNRYWDFTGEMGKTYYYWVAASNAWGLSPLSAAVAGWRPAGWTVSFDANGGTGSMPALTVARGKTEAIPDCGFSRTGWSFVGWATSAGGSAVYQDKANLTPTGDLTLYAKWTANTYAVTLDRQNGTGGSASATATYGSALPAITVPTRTGYSFRGYYTAANGSGTQYYTASGTSARIWDKAAATTLYAKWAANAYAVTLDRQSGTGGSASATATYGSALPAITAPTRTGYTFGGYYTSANGGGTQYYTASGASAHTWDRTAATTLYAKWTANTYAVTLDRQNGTGGSATATASYGSALPSITVPMRTGYAFGGYYTAANGGGTQYYTTAGASARTWDRAAATTLYAKWTANTYTVTLNRQNGVGGSASATATYGSALPSITVPTRSGYTFGGYYTAANGSGTQYYTASGSSARAWDRTAATTLHAKWTANTYTVTLNRQSGTGGSSSATATYGAAMPAITAPTRTGYTFDGYYTAPNGGGAQYYTASGASARVWDRAAASTLYAKWTGRPYAVTLDFQGGTGGTEAVTATYGSALPSISAPTLEGLFFGGYWTEPDGEGVQYYGAAGTSIRTWDRAAPATLYAFWTESVPSSVYRFYSKAYKGHFFTVSEEEKDTLIATNPNWKFEGTAYMAFTNEAPGTVALYRFYSKGYRGHFFTIDEAEMRTVRDTNPNWKYEGIAYYVYPEEVEGSVPVYRFWSKGYRHHFYTIDEAEKDTLIATNPNWKYETVAFWALPAEDAKAKFAMHNAPCTMQDAQCAPHHAEPDVQGFALETEAGARIATPGVAKVGNALLETRGEAPDAAELAFHAESAEVLPFRLTLPGGVWNASLWSAAEGTLAEEEPEETFDFALPTDCVWHWLRVLDGDGIEAFSLWLRAE